MAGLSESNAFSFREKRLPADEIIPTKLALNTRICLRDDMQIDDINSNSWSLTACSRLLNNCISFKIPFNLKQKGECLLFLIRNMDILSKVVRTFWNTPKAKEMPL